MNYFKPLLQRLLAPLCAVLLLVAAFFPYPKEKNLCASCQEYVQPVKPCW